MLRFVSNIASQDPMLGAVDVRDDEEEQKNIQILKSKWGDKIKLNPKRKNEILI